MAGMIGNLITIAVVGFIFWWLKRRFPAPQLTDDGPTLEELLPKYRGWSLFTTVGVMVLWVPLTALVFAGLYRVVGWYSATLQDSTETFVFCIPPKGYLVPAFFVAILLSMFVMSGILKLLLRERYNEFLRFDALRLGVDQGRLMGILIVVIAVGCTLSVLWLLGIYLVASPTELRVNPPFGFERRYSYSELTEVITAPAHLHINGKRINERVYKLQFRDGTFFSTQFMPTPELHERSVEMLIDAILQRSGLMLKEKPVFERGELEL
jgi:hypothetical protein